MYFFKSIIFILLFLGTSLSAENKKLQDVSVQLEWKHQFEFAGFYAALEQGYYKGVGLNVEIKEYDTEIDIISDVLSGVSTYGMSSSHLILERLSGKKIIQLASYFKQNALVLITKPDIKTIADLKNKKVMAATNELVGTSLAAMFQEHDVDINEIKIIPHTFNIDAFSKGDVDAMTAFISNQPFLLEQQQIPYKVFNPSQDGIYSYDVELFSSEQEVKDYPLRTQNFIEATRKGWEYALLHKEEIIDLIYHKYSKRKSKEALMYEANTISKLMKIDLFKIGSVIPELTQLNTNMYVKLGMVEKNWDLEGFIFNPMPREINLTPVESAFIKDHPVIRFSDVHWEPFASISGNTYSGIFKTYYKLLEQRTGIKFEFIKIGDGINFQFVLDALKNKEIDMIDGSGKTEERKKYSLFAGPMMQVSLAIVSHKQNRYTDLNSLNGKRIAVAKGSTASEYIKEYFPQINLLYTDSIDEALDLVSKQKSDAVLDNLIVLDNMIKNNSYFHQIGISGISDYKFNIYSLIRDDYPLLHQIIDKAIKSISKEELLSIHNKLLQSTVQTSKIQKDFLSPKELAFIRKHENMILTEDEKQYLDNKKELTMCIDPDWMPFEKIENDKHIGMSSEYMKILQSKIGKPITLIPTQSWVESLENIKKRDCDIVPLSMETPSRREYMSFTEPYLDLPLVIATTYDKLFVSDSKELEGKRIGIVRGYAEKEILQHKYKNIHFVDVDNVKDGLTQVVEGKLYGFIENLSVMGYQIQKYFPHELKVTGRLNEKFTLSIGIRNDQPMLLHIFNKALRTIDDKTKQNILNHWVSIKYEQGFDYKLFWYILTPFLLLALLLLISYYLLRKYNIKLEKEVNNKVEELLHKDEILLKKHRMAEMGEMLSMIAHQWRQPLGAISSAFVGIEVKIASGKFNLDNKNDQEKFITYLQRKHHSINEYVQHLSTTTDDFRNFFNPNKSKDSVLLTAPIEKALQLVEESMKNNGIEIIKDFKINNKIELYQNEVLQVILNILKNCEDNFLEKNIVAPKVTITTCIHDNNYSISICDNGEGIPQDIVDQIFDPYFTTKDEKNGAGLGLYMSKMIIEDHHLGILNVKNIKEGLCVEIIFRVEESHT